MAAPWVSRRPPFVTGPRVVGFVAALAVGALVVWQLRSEEYESVASWRERLATVAAERAHLIDNWVREREMDARALAALPLARELVGGAGRTAAAEPRLRLLRRHIDHFCDTYGYADAALLDAEGSLLASCSGRSPSAETARWALAVAGETGTREETIELGAEGFALRFAAPVLPEPAERPGATGTGALVLTTRPLVSLEHIILTTVGGTRTGRIEIRAVAPEGDGRFLQATVPVLGGTRVLVAKVRRSEALAAARAAAVSQGLVAVVAILLPLLIATIGWQRDRTRALREALGQQRSLLEARAYAESIVQSIDAVVWEAEVREDAGGQKTDTGLDRWRFSFVSKRVESLLGRPTEAWVGHANLWLDCISPDDRPRVAQFYAEVTAQASHEGSIEFCAKRPDGSEVWLRDRVIVSGEENRARRLRGVLVDLTERVRAERDTTALLAVARDVSSARDRQELFRRVQRRTAEVLPCDRVVTFLLDPEREMLRVAAHHGVLPERVAVVEALELRAGQALGGRVLAGDTVVLNHVREQPWLPVSLYESFGVNAFVATPLLLGGRPAGALVAFAVEPNRAPFEARQATLLEGIARQLAVGLEVSRYHEAQAEEAIVSGALARVSRELIASPAEPEALLVELCRLTVEILGCDVSHTILQGPGEDTLALAASAGASPEHLASLAAMRLPADVAAPFHGELLAQGVACLGAGRADDGAAQRLRVALGVETLLCMPLRPRDGKVGIHCAGYREPGTVSARHLRIARGLAGLASTVFDRAQLVAELERANRVRSDFIATMSHELRTPLHIILGYQEMLLDGGVGSLTAEQQDALARCHRSARTLLDLVDATLDLTRLESGRDPYAGPPVSVEAVVDEVAAELVDLSRNPEVSLVVEHASRLPPLPVDPVKLRVIVKNLVGNAIKFTDRGTIVVQTRALDQGVELAVRDPGIGIPGEALAFIFEPFRQVDSSSTRRHGGVGLGLHIVQRLVEALGGRISVESEVGRGSTFRVWLPEVVARVKEQAA